MRPETKSCVLPEAEASPAGLSGEGLARDSLGTGAETEVGGTRGGEGGEEVGGPEQEQKEEVTLEDVCRLAVELSEINNQRSCEISELLNDTKNLLNSWTANQTSDDEEDDGEQGDDENDLLVLFDSLGKQLKTFQRDLTSTDKKVENAKKTSSPLRKKGGNDVSCLNNPCLWSAKTDQLAKLDQLPDESACCNINIKQEPPREPLKLAKHCKLFLFPFFSFF